jgi:hypothetical protein
VPAAPPARPGPATMKLEGSGEPGGSGSGSSSEESPGILYLDGTATARADGSKSRWQEQEWNEAGQGGDKWAGTAGAARVSLYSRSGCTSDWCSTGVGRCGRPPRVRTCGAGLHLRRNGRQEILSLCFILTTDRLCSTHAKCSKQSDRCATLLRDARDMLQRHAAYTQYVRGGWQRASAPCQYHRSNLSALGSVPLPSYVRTYHQQRKAPRSRPAT